MGTLARMETMGDDIRINEARIETATTKIVSLGHKQEALHRSEGANTTLQLLVSKLGSTNYSFPHSLLLLQVFRGHCGTVEGGGAGGAGGRGAGGGLYGGAGHPLQGETTGQGREAAPGDPAA